MIPISFINHASDILGDTLNGLSGSKIVEYLSAYAVDFSIDIPHSDYPFSDLPNKRTALKENLKCFPPKQQFQIIKELCELEQFNDNKSVKDLKIKLVTRFSKLNTKTDSEINETLIEETKHWLNDYPEPLKLFDEALHKYQSKIFERNLLDDLRLSLELLLKKILENDKSFENQLAEIGKFIQEKNGSKELNNMFVKLIDYFAKYQNTYVKHNDAVIESEIEFIYEMTCSFMKLLIRMK